MYDEGSITLIPFPAPGGFMRRIAGITLPAIMVMLAAIAPVCAHAQASTLKIIGTDHLPVPFAVVSVGGGSPSITNEQGELSLGRTRQKAIGVMVRRIGYQVLADTIDLPDTATLVTLTLSRVPQNLQPVIVDGTAQKSRLELVGFYSRWLKKQRDGLRDATFIGPEAIELRNPAVTTDLFSQVLGVTLRVDSRGIRSARGVGQRPQTGATVPQVATASANVRGECFMSVLIDGRPVCPPAGCHYVFADDPPGSLAEDHSLDLDKLVAPKDIAGIEVYPRRDGMPDNVLKTYEGCGVIMIWTGRR
jgi:hypothetical protein